MRYLLTGSAPNHPGVLATAGSLEAIERAKKILARELCPGYPLEADSWFIIGPLAGDPEDGTIPDRF